VPGQWPPDQFPFGIKVRCNGDPVGLAGKFLEKGNDLLLGRHFDRLCINQAPRGKLLAPPVAVARLEIDLHDMAAETHGGRIPERVGRDAGIL